MADVKTLRSDRSEAGGNRGGAVENLSIEIVIEDPHLMAGSRDVVCLKEASFAVYMMRPEPPRARKQKE